MAEKNEIMINNEIEYPSFTDISKWDKIAYANTGGTRSKKIYYDHEGENQYFFKGSKKLDDGTFKYPSEFWSEIASSKIGQMLTFDLLDYNIAYDVNAEQQIGCLSKSMIRHSDNKLAEGLDFLRAVKPLYDPKINGDEYTLEFIINALKYVDLDNALPKIIDMIVFDACIGNSDRHQENWGFITHYKEAMDAYEDEIGKSKGYFKKNTLRLLKWLLKRLTDQEFSKHINFRNKIQIVPTLFSPIYDSGCSLGRENSENKIASYMKDPKLLESYIGKKGKSEIRWAVGKKPSHFDLLSEISKEYPEEFKNARSRVEENYSKERLSELIQNIDINLPGDLKAYKLEDYRKEFMIKSVDLRIEKVLLF